MLSKVYVNFSYVAFAVSLFEIILLEYEIKQEKGIETRG